jgi:hypothetical protein
MRVDTDVLIWLTAIAAITAPDRSAQKMSGRAPAQGPAAHP